MSAGRITSPSSIEYTITRAPDKPRLVDSWKYRFDDTVQIDAIFRLSGMIDGETRVADFNVQVESLEYSQDPDVVKFSGFIATNGMTIRGVYNVKNREGKAELLM